MARGSRTAGLAVLGLALGAGATPRLEQLNEATSVGTPLIVSLPAPSRAGDTIVVALTGQTAPCFVVDSASNVYTAASPPLTGIGQFSAVMLQVQYAGDITATAAPLVFTVSNCTDVEVRVFEYSGLAAAPFDAEVGAVSATMTAIDSGVLNTTFTEDLLFSVNISYSSVDAPGSGFSVRNVYSSDLVQDRVVDGAGPYLATATADDPTWIAQLVAFKADLAFDGGPLDSGLGEVDLGGGFHFVQGNAAYSSLFPLTVPLPVVSTPGDTLIVCTNTSLGACTLTDDQGSIYTVVRPAQQGQGVLASFSQTMYRATVATLGPRPLELLLDCANYGSLFVAEYSGFSDAGVDVTAATASTSAFAMQVGPVQTLAANELAVACGGSHGDISAVDAGVGLQVPFNGDALLDQLVASPGPYTAIAASSDPAWIFSVAVFVGVGEADAGAADAGVEDSGVLDGGSGQDGGSALDAGNPADAGNAADAGNPVDAGNPIDAGNPSSGSRELNLGCGCQSAPIGLILIPHGVRRRRRRR